MRIAVGSGNPVKRDATARVFPASTVVTEPVPSGVAEQPMGHNETRRGARNRAIAALRAGAYNLGVGIEGGVASFGRSNGSKIGDGSNDVDSNVHADADSHADADADSNVHADADADNNADTDADADNNADTDADDLFLVMWAAVTDGERRGVGAGPSLLLPESIAARVRDGEELGPVMDDILGESNVARKQGAAGAFTDGRLSRTDALDAAVTAAASPFLSDLY